MFAIAFDLVVREVSNRHPKGIPQADGDIATTLGEFGFRRVQGSVYVCADGDLTNLFRAMTALKGLAWFADCVRDIRAFRIEHWSDFTPLIKEAI